MKRKPARRFVSLKSARDAFDRMCAERDAIVRSSSKAIDYLTSESHRLESISVEHVGKLAASNIECDKLAVECSRLRELLAKEQQKNDRQCERIEHYQSQLSIIHTVVTMEHRGI